MPKRYFFDIPVYRCSIDKYISETENFREKLKDYYMDIPVYQDLDEVEVEKSVNGIIENIMMLHEVSWIFNEIIAYIRLYVLDNRILAEDFIVMSRVTKRSRNKVFRINGTVFELNIKTNWSDGKIYSEILKKIENLQSIKGFKNRYIDLETIKIAGPLLKWKKMLRL